MNLISFTVFFIPIVVVVAILFGLSKKSSQKSNIEEQVDNEIIHIRYRWFSVMLPIITMIVLVLMFWAIVFFESDERNILIAESAMFILTTLLTLLYIKKKKALNWK